MHIVSCMNLLWDWFKKLSIILRILLSYLLCLKSRSIDLGLYMSLPTLESDLARAYSHVPVLEMDIDVILVSG
jgi:hypothetical protein